MPFHNPFEALGALMGRLPETPANGPAEAPPPAAAPARTGKTYPRAVVRLERSGRGGKEVTVVEHLDLSVAEREEWLKSLKAALGCGGKVEAAAIVLQGDHRNRLTGLLADKGVKKVVGGTG